MHALERTFLRLFWILHRWLFRISRGRLGARLQGLNVLLLRSKGRRSGQLRENMLYFLPHPDGYLVAASNAGARHPPAWYFNLKAHPDTSLLTQGRTIEVRAREMEGVEYEEHWARFLASKGGYNRYASMADRHIPVMLLGTQMGR